MALFRADIANEKHAFVQYVNLRIWLYRNCYRCRVVKSEMKEGKVKEKKYLYLNIFIFIKYLYLNAKGARRAKREKKSASNQMRQRESEDIKSWMQALQGVHIIEGVIQLLADSLEFQLLSVQLVCASPSRERESRWREMQNGSDHGVKSGGKKREVRSKIKD